MDEIVQEAVRKYAAIAPEDLRDTEVFARRETLEHLVGLMQLQPPQGIDLSNATLFGLRLRADDSMPFGTVRFVTENEQDRAIRRARAFGHSINIVKMPPPMAFSMAEHMPPPPTLAGLLKHWGKKIRGKS